MSHHTLRVLQIDRGMENPVFYLPSAKFVRPLFLGHENLGADLIWIRTLGYFADEIGRGKRFEYLQGLINLATDLDPRFEKLYMWAGAIYMYRGGAIREEHILASNEILKKGWNVIQTDPRGWRHDPNYWMIPQMIGFNYAVELKDRERGAPFIVETAKIPGSPQLYKTWAATIYRRAGKEEKGLSFLEEMLAIETLQSQLQNVQDEALKERIRDRLFFYYSRQGDPDRAEERVRILERRIQQYFQEWKQSFPFLGFTQFLVLRGYEEKQDERFDESIWEKTFPLLSLEK